MRLPVLSLLLVLTASGCASVNKLALDAATGSGLKGQTVAATARDKPSFAAMTAGKAAFALVGAAVAISEGNRIIADNTVADPAVAIGERLAQVLESRYGMQFVPTAVPVASNDVATIAKAYGDKARYALDVETVNWSTNYFVSDWSRYRVIYTAKARLIDLRGGAVVAEGFCKRIPESVADAPTYDELMADNAARLKQELGLGADACVESLQAEMLPS